MIYVSFFLVGARSSLCRNDQVFPSEVRLYSSQLRCEVLWQDRARRDLEIFARSHIFKAGVWQVWAWQQRAQCCYYVADWHRARFSAIAPACSHWMVPGSIPNCVGGFALTENGVKQLNRDAWWRSLGIFLEVSTYQYRSYIEKRKWRLWICETNMRCAQNLYLRLRAYIVRQPDISSSSSKSLT